MKFDSGDLVFISAECGFSAANVYPTPPPIWQRAAVVEVPNRSLCLVLEVKADWVRILSHRCVGWTHRSFLKKVVKPRRRSP